MTGASRLRSRPASPRLPRWRDEQQSDAALEAAVQAGGQIAHPPLEIPGHGTFAIYHQGGDDHGLWQL